MRYGAQVVSLGVIFAIIINYLRSKKMPLFSTKIFSAYLWASFFNIVFEFCTLYTITRLDTMPELNRLAHQLFIGSMDAIVFLLFLYVDFKSRKQKRYTARQLLIRLVPFAASLVVVAFGHLEYRTQNGVSYSYGSMATTVYASVLVYVLAIFYLLRRKQIGFSRSAKSTIAIGMIFWAAIALYQFFNPTVLISSMGVSIMVLFLYISFEHPAEYSDHEVSGCLNRFAFELILQENFAKKKPFYVVSVHVLKRHLLINSFGNDYFCQLLSRIVFELRGARGCRNHRSCYHSRSSVITMVMTPAEYAAFSGRAQKPLCCCESRPAIDTGRFVSVIACPEFAGTRDDVKKLLSFISETGEAEEFSGTVEVNESTLERMRYMDGVESLLQTAIACDGFDVFYQPIYSTEKKGFISSEALIRLKDTKTLGFISPEIFIPLAEQKGLIKEIGNIVFEKVCSFSSENALFENGLQYIEINLSGVQSVDTTLVDALSEIMNRHGIDPSCINLEITETAAIENGKLLLDNMKRLKALGCQFSMDDFGTGYSNLAQMADTEFDLIKLDKSLLWSCFVDGSEKARFILNGCIDLIQNLKIHIVQEGVETKEQADFLIARNVSYLQGYYYSKPISGPAYLEFLRTHAAAV